MENLCHFVLFFAAQESNFIVNSFPFFFLIWRCHSLPFAARQSEMRSEKQQNKTKSDFTSQFAAASCCCCCFSSRRIEMFIPITWNWGKWLNLIEIARVELWKMFFLESQAYKLFGSFSLLRDLFDFDVESTKVSIFPHFIRGFCVRVCLGCDCSYFLFSTILNTSIHSN